MNFLCMERNFLFFTFMQSSKWRLFHWSARVALHDGMMMDDWLMMSDEPHVVSVDGCERVWM